MTNLEKQIVATIQNGGDIWDVVKIAQQYNNEQLIDRVLDNILKFGLEKILEKPNRIFYGDNHKILPLEEELVGVASIEQPFEGFGIGKEYDEAVEIICTAGLDSFADYIKACQNRKPQVAAKYDLHLPDVQWKTIYRKTNPQITSNLRKLCCGIGIEIPECDRVIDLPEGICCLNHNTTNVTIIIIK